MTTPALQLDHQVVRGGDESACVTCRPISVLYIEVRAVARISGVQRRRRERLSRIRHRQD